MATLSSANTRKRNSFLSANPVMRRLDKVDEYSESDAATYNGIATKTALYMLVTLGGIILYLLLEKSLSTGASFTVKFKGFPVELYTSQTIAVGVCLVLAIVFQLLAFFVKASTPVTGALYCITQGYFIAFLVFAVLGSQYQYLGVLALIITLFIVAAMAFLYSKGIIRVTKKFKLVMTTLVITMVGTTLLTTIAYFIPFTRNLVSGIINNYVFSIISSVIFIIIAALFLICDFDTIDHVVNDKLPKKYEWQAAFGLAFTVLWIYIKVLELLMTVVGRGKK